MKRKGSFNLYMFNYWKQMEMYEYIWYVIILEYPKCDGILLKGGVGWKTEWKTEQKIDWFKTGL